MLFDAIAPGTRPVLRQAALRAAITIFGLAIYWQLGMRDLHDFGKAAVFTVIANTGVAGLLLQSRQRWVTRFAPRFAILLNGLVLVNAAVEGFLFWLYGLTPKHIVVADAILGSNADETREFLETYWPHLLLVALLPIAFIAFSYWVERRAERRSTPVRAGGRRTRWTGAAMLALFIALHLNPTMAQENPLVYWPGYVADYRAQRAFLDGVKHKVASDLQTMRRDVVYAGPPEQTVVLVLGESVNRSNWSLYQYPRNTTPRLAAQRDQMLVFKQVTSADAATVQSLLKMLTPATVEHPDAWLTGPNVLALARSAGYKVFWLSNQEQGDGPIQILAEHAHEQIFVNNGRGREARSLDERLLPHLQAVLARPDPRKLIVVHMQGAHLRYDLRYPPAFDKFSGADDAVAKGMYRAGRPYWIRRSRNQYDNAMLYTDYVLSAMLDQVRHTPQARATSFLYVSDHGQEVGHYRNFAGHSSTEASGYQVPLLFWTNDWDGLPKNRRAALEGRAYRTDVLDHTLLRVLDIRTRSYRPENDLLNLQAERLALGRGGPPLR